MATERTNRRLDEYPVSLQRAAYAIYGDRIRQELEDLAAERTPAVGKPGVQRKAA